MPQFAKEEPDELFWIFHLVGGTPVFVILLTLQFLLICHLILLWHDEF